MSPEEKLRLTHIAEAAALIANQVQGVSKEAFLSDTLRQDAVIRRIQIIGEAVRHQPHELLAGMPDFPAKQARGMRNVLVHDYDAVNLERLWDTAIQDMRQGGNVADRSAFTVRRSPFGVHRSAFTVRRSPFGVR